MYIDLKEEPIEAVGKAKISRKGGKKGNKAIANIINESELFNKSLGMKRKSEMFTRL
jgi:hypothetical protein